MSPGFGLVQAPAYVWPAALSSAIRGTGSDMQGVCVRACMCVGLSLSACLCACMHALGTLNKHEGEVY